MESIQMMDLITQYNAIREEMDTAVLQSIRSGQYINGNEVGRFTEALSAYTGSNVVTCGNGTDALQIALMALDLKPGDEVIVPAFTYMAAAEAVALLGLTPVAVDVDLQTFNMDVTKIPEALSARTKAIIPVHLFGQTSDMAPLMDIAQQYNLFVIEDNAQSIGAVYSFPDGTKKQAGTIGTIGTLSFFPTKNLGCYGDGGALMTSNKELAQKIQMIGRHGQSQKYHHQMIGCNSRLDTLQAAILNIKLDHLEQYTLSRQKAADYYRKNMSFLTDFLELPYVAPYSTHVSHQFTIRVKEGKRDALQLYLKEKGIPSAVYYPLPIHHQEAFRPLIKIAGDLRVSEALSKTVLSLPMHTELSENQQDYIIDQISEFFK